MRKKICLIGILCLILLALTACKKKEESKQGPYIYYTNTQGTALVKKSYHIQGDSAEDEIQDVLSEMTKTTETIDYKSVFPKDVKIEKWERKDSKLQIYFNSAYRKMSDSDELLLRAALVQSLVQVSGVDYVGIYVDGQPFVNKSGKEVGYLREEDFVENTGSSLHSYQKGDLNLYFANDKGDHLVKEETSVRYNSNLSIEKLIVEELMKGPSSNGTKPTIPPETKVLGVSTKDGICYVNFDEGFMSSPYEMDARLTIYSIVNSIVEGGEANQVQILVNGERDVIYQGGVDLSKPLSENLELVKEDK